MPISEIQCRWAARVFAKKAKKLVSENDMHSDILKVQREMSERYISSQRHTIQVDAGN
jgi:dimethylaniline monooxygenase (N-oxide forming)